MEFRLALKIGIVIIVQASENPPTLLQSWRTWTLLLSYSMSKISHQSVVVKFRMAYKNGISLLVQVSENPSTLLQTCRFFPELKNLEISIILHY